MNHYTYQHVDAVNFHRHIIKGIDRIIDHANALHKAILPSLNAYYPDLDGYVKKLMQFETDLPLEDALDTMLNVVDDTAYTLQARPFPITDAHDNYPLLVNTVTAHDKRQWVYLMIPYPSTFIGGALAKEKMMTLALAYRRSNTFIHTFAPIVTPQDGLPGPSSITITESDFKAYKACMDIVGDLGYLKHFQHVRVQPA